MKCEACPFDAWKQPELCQTFVIRRGETAGLLPVMEFDESVVAEASAPRAQRKKARAKKAKGFRGEPEAPRRRRKR